MYPSPPPGPACLRLLSSLSLTSLSFCTATQQQQHQLVKQSPPTPPSILYVCRILVLVIIGNIHPTQARIAIRLHCALQDLKPSRSVGSLLDERLLRRYAVRLWMMHGQNRPRQQVSVSGAQANSECDHSSFSPLPLRRFWFGCAIWPGWCFRRSTGASPANGGVRPCSAAAFWCTCTKSSGAYGRDFLVSLGEYGDAESARCLVGELSASEYGEYVVAVFALAGWYGSLEDIGMGALPLGETT